VVKYLSLIIIGFFAPLILSPFSAEAKSTDLERLLSEDSEGVQKLVSYPTEVQQAVLEASLYPKTLEGMEHQREQTRNEFQKIISKYPRSTQEQVYNLVRYPDLLHTLVDGGQKSKKEIKNLTADFPKGVQKGAEELGRKEYPLLKNIDALHARSDRAFDRLIEPLPTSSQSAYRKLLRYPEVLDSLSNNPDLTVALAKAYRANPSQTKAKLSEWSQTANSQKEEALTDYRETLKNDPKAQEDLKRSAEEFSEEYGYYGDEEDYPPPQNYSGTTVVNINIDPYPYWFGYPYWYASPVWYPYPLWYLTGFSIGFGGGFFVWGWPSFWYTNWFFGYPYNFYRYPYVSSCYGRNYYHYRNYPIYNGYYPVIKAWHREHRDIVSNDLFRNDRHQVERWRDFGNRSEKQRAGYSRGRSPGFEAPGKARVEKNRRPTFSHPQEKITSVNRGHHRSNAQIKENPKSSFNHPQQKITSINKGPHRNDAKIVKNPNINSRVERGSISRNSNRGNGIENRRVSPTVRGATPSAVRQRGPTPTLQNRGNISRPPMNMSPSPRSVSPSMGRSPGLQRGGSSFDGGRSMGGGRGGGFSRAPSFRGHR
jgi:hypothetical protein